MPSTSQWWNTLSSIAYQWGPFFFAVLFSLLITRTARNWYVNVSHGPEPSGTLIEEHRKYFHYTFIFSFSLVILSTGWYFYTNFNRYHPFEAIISLEQNQNIDSNQIYGREYTGTKVGDPKEFHFVILRDHPIQKGEKIYLYYWESSVTSGVGAPPPKKSIPMELVDATLFPQRFRLDMIEGTPTIVAEGY